jgi:hypothetical protein
MFKKISALLISMSLLSAQFATVYAENNDKTQLPPNNEQTVEYCTDRFIVKTETGISTFSENEINVSDEEIAIAMNEALSDVEQASDKVNVSDVSFIEENSSVVTLSENVNADEFIQAVEDTFGDAVTVQPDYPIYMAQTINSTAISDIETTAVTATPAPKADWNKSLSDAKAVSTGEGARIAVLGGYYENTNNTQEDYIVDEYNFVGTSLYAGAGISSPIISDIHSIAPQANIIPIGVFGLDYYAPGWGGFAYTSDIVKGISYARNKGAQVIVGDWRVSQYNAYLESKIKESGILFITSASEGDTFSAPAPSNMIHIPVPEKEYPACFDIENVLTVGSLKDDYNKYFVVPYEDDIDIYSMNYTTSYHSTAVSAVAGAAALVIGKNNSADNLKDILMSSAATVSYLPGTKNAETYKVLDFYDAVMGYNSSKNIKVTIPRSDNSNYYKYYGWQPSIIYTEIEQVEGGCYAMASLTKDGKVILTTVNTDYYNPMPSDIDGTIYPTLKKHGFPVEVPGLSDIVQIAMTDDGRGLVALDKNGDMYLYGNKYSLGLSSDTKSFFATPFKCENIDNANNIESIYATYQRVWIQKKNTTEQNTETYEMKLSEDNNIIFEKIEAATDAKIYMQKNYNYYPNTKGNVYFLKDGTVYTETTSKEGVKAYPEVTNINGYITDIYPSSSGIYTLDSNGTMTDPKIPSTSTNTPQYLYNVTQMEGAGNAVLYKRANDSDIKMRTSDGGSYIYDYKTKISSDKNIKSICSFDNGYYMHPSPTSYYGTIFVLTEDGMLYYIPGRYYSPTSTNNNTEKEVYMGIAAQSTFEEQNVHSVVPVNLVMEYGSATSDLSAFLSEKTFNRATITLDDGTDISVPVQWDTSNYNPNELGKQTFEGELTLPENITNTQTLRAKANVKIKTPISAVENFNLEVDFDTPLSEIESQLPEKAKIWRTKPYGENENPIELDVVWDTSNYKADEPGTYEIIGTLQIPDELKDTISNSFNRRPVTTVKIKPYIEPDKNVTGVGTIEDVTVEYDAALSDVKSQLPSSVTVTLEDGTTDNLEVVWESKSTYNPTAVSIKQEFIGTLVEKEGIKNDNALTASVNVIVMPEAVGNITRIDTVPLETDQSVPFEQIEGLPNEVEVEVDNGKTAMLPVIWDKTYEPDADMPSDTQWVMGTVDLTNTQITNENNIPASLSIRRYDASYTVTSVTPASAEVSVEYGTTFDEIMALGVIPETITLNMKKNDDRDKKTLSVPRSLTILDTDNKGFNPNYAGTHTIIARPVVSNNMTIADDMYFTLYVTVKEQHSVKKIQAEHIATYVYTPASELTLPETVNVQLDDDSIVPVEVDWNMSGYNPNTAGYQMISGKFKEGSVPANVNLNNHNAVLSIYVKDVQYDVLQLFDGDFETIPAGLDIDEIYEQLESKEVEIEIQTKDKKHTTHTYVPFTIDTPNDEYKYDEIDMYTLNATLTLPENISNDGGLKHEVMVYLWPVEIDLENTTSEFDDITVTKGTPVSNFGLPTSLPVTLMNGKTIDVENIIWKEDAVQKDANKVTLTGTGDFPSYVMSDGFNFKYTVTLEEAEATYDILAIENDVLPSDGSILRIPLGTPLSEIPALLNEQVKVILDGTGDKNDDMLDIEIKAEDNPDYSLDEVGTYELTAQLVLPANMNNPDSLTVTVNVETYKKTIKAIKPITISGIAAGTPFSEIGAPTKVAVTFTDGSTEDINVAWNENQYDPNPPKSKNELIYGTLEELPYIENPNNVKVYLVAKVVVPTNAKLLSLTPVTETPSLFSIRARFTAPKKVAVNQLSDNLIERKYIAEYEEEDGTITTEEISIFEIIE